MPRYFGLRQRETIGVPEAMVQAACYVAAATLAALIALVLLVTFLILAMSYRPAAAKELRWDDQHWLLSWVPYHCCVTQRCCFEVLPGTVEHLGGERWRVVASNQRLAQNGWSKDQRFWRCACDQDSNGKWVVHDKAFTRCLYPPRPMT